MESWTASSADGQQIVAYELGGEGEVVVLSHATGFCGPMYRRLAAGLLDQFRVVTFDYRGHGQSRCSDMTDIEWDRMAEDLAAVVEALDVGPVHVFGHSMGGSASLLTAAARPELIRSQYLFEPVIFPPHAPSLTQNVMADSARRRRPAFASRGEAFERYADRPPFDTMQSSALADYLRFAFDEESDGIRLRCLPTTEANVFEGGRSMHLDRVRHISTPTTVGRGKLVNASPPSRYAIDLAEALSDACLNIFDDLTHLAPFESPTRICTALLAHLNR